MRQERPDAAPLLRCHANAIAAWSASWRPWKTDKTWPTLFLAAGAGRCPAPVE